MVSHATGVWLRGLRGSALLALSLLAACQNSTLQPSSAPGFNRSAAATGGPANTIVLLEPRSNPALVAREYGIDPQYVYTQVAVGFAGPISDAARAGLLRDSRIVALVPDAPIELTETQTSATWGLDRLDQRSLPLDGTYSFGYNGAGVSAYIIDSGIRFDHSEFGGRAVPGYDAMNDGLNSADCSGHGTHVAGTVGGRTAGVAKGVRLVSVRVVDCSGRGSVSGLIAGIDWVAKNHVKPAVANISIAASYSGTLNQALQKMIAAGVQASVSAANDGGDACLKSPGSTPDAITVAATTSSDVRPWWSNYGSCVDVFAPGSSITSASISGPTDFTLKSGTSMAAPHVTGVTALLLAENPTRTTLELRQRVFELSTKNAVIDAQSEMAHLLYSVAGSEPPRQPEPEPEPTPEPNPGPIEPTQEPAAPSSLVASLSTASSVALGWRDESGNESGFEIRRQAGSDGFQTLARVGANATSFTDTSVQTNATYSYRVFAYNEAGTSPSSNEATVTVTCSSKGKSRNCR